MEILHVTDYLPGYHSRWSGAEQACLRLLYLLNKNGYKISVVSTKPQRNPQEHYNFFSLSIYISEDLLPHKLRHIFSHIKAIIPFDLVVFFQFFRLILKIKPNIIHIHNFKHLSLSIVCVARILKIPVVVSIYDYWIFCPKENLIDPTGKTCFKFHGYSCMDCLGMPIYSKYLLMLRRIFFDLFLNRIGAFIVLSKSSSLIIERYGIDKEKIHIIYQTSPFREKFTEDAVLEIKNPSLLFVGNLSFNKGVHIAIESLAFIKNQIPDVRLYIVGVVREYADKRCIDRLAQIIEQYNLEKSVFFLERQTSAKMHSIFNKVDVVIIPEQWPNMSPVVLMEAMVLAKPIVTSNIGGIPEFIRDGQTGFLATPQDPHEFAQKVIWLLKNPESAKRIGENARIDALKIWNDDVNLRKIIELYESLLR